MKKLLILILCFVFIGIGGASAKAVEGEYVFEAGTEIYYFQYEEPDVMKEEGAMFGILGSYSFISDYLFKIDGRYVFGQVDYENSGTVNDIDDFVFEFRSVAGKAFPLRTEWTLTPYTGFGYRYLNDDLSGKTSSTGAKGYERESNYWYSPIGIEVKTPLKNGWNIGGVFEYDHFWKGIQKSHLSDVDASISDIENDQKEGYGLRASVRFQKEGEKFDFVIEPFVRYWDIKESETANITVNGAIWGFGWEPENDTTEAGVKFIAQF